MVIHRLCTAAVVLMGLLVGATSAHADGGWVVWQELTGMSADAGAPPRASKEWDIVQATSTEAECRAALAQTVQARADKMKRPGADGKAPNVTVDQQTLSMQFPGALFAYRFVCLPATIDPRGPTGK